MATVGGFLGYVSYRDPWLGKALDYLLGAACQGAEKEHLEILLPEGSVAAELVTARHDSLSGYAAEFFGRRMALKLVLQPPPAGELRLFPIESSKEWNQILFFLGPAGAAGCDELPAAAAVGLVIGKRGYRELQHRFSPAAGRRELEDLLAELDGVLLPPGELAELVDGAVPRARSRRGIVHLVTLAGSEREALNLDYAVARLKEYGSPGHEGPLELKTLLGRLHLVYPGQFCAGLALLHRLAG
jgi:hypothetical protein